MKRLLGNVCVLAFSIPILLASADDQTGKFGDQGDGTYRNPIIAADYSDPDVIRVGSDYYMVASTFQLSPGLVVLHSKDLVNWQTIGAAMADVSQLGADFNWDRMNRYNEGVYAPSIRFHDGKFWIFVNCHSGEGFYQATATNPAGPWTVTQIEDKNGKLLRTGGWTDPCPLWDDDGKAYLASSRPSGHWFGYLFQMTPDGTKLLDADVDKMNKSIDKAYAFPEGGTLFSPFQSTEGNKLFKRNGYYYLQHIEFLDSGHGHGTYVMRSKNIYGTKPDGSPGSPGDVGNYEIMKFGDAIPGQGGFVDTPEGKWYWIGQVNNVATDGRKPYLLPVTWVDDWPVPGVNIKNGKGDFAWQLPKPIAGEAITLPQGSDEFNSPNLNPEWFWNYQPSAGKWSLMERPGFMRLYGCKPLEPHRFFKVYDVLAQRHFRSDSTVTETKMDVSGMADGQEAGLVHFDGGRDYATLSVVQNGGARNWKYEEKGKAIAGAALPVGTQFVWIKSTTGSDEVNSYFISTDGQKYVAFGGKYKLVSAGYRGDEIGLYTFNSDQEAGYVDFDFFHYTVQNK